MNPFALVRRVAALLADPRAPRLPRAAVGLAIIYLLLPTDLVPDFLVPVGGYLDDFALLWFSVRWLLRATQQPTVRVEPPAPGSLGPAPPVPDLPAESDPPSDPRP